MTGNHQEHRAALEAESQPGTIGHVLAAYRERLGLDLAGLATWLHVTPTRLAALALERRPDPAGAAFVDRVRALADRYGADPWRLADALG